MHDPKCWKSFHITKRYKIRLTAWIYFPLTFLLTAESEANFSVVAAAEGQKYDRAKRLNAAPKRW